MATVACAKGGMVARRAKRRPGRFAVEAGIAAMAVGMLPDASRAGDVAYGGYLAQECATCHRSEVEAGGIPPIAGLPATYFASALKDYRAGRRANPVMQSVARSLDDEQILALAAYYASLKPGEGTR